MTKLFQTPPKLKRKNSLSFEVIEYLRKAISDGKLPPGTKLPTEQALALQMGVSRTVIREAVAALKADGLVKSRQGVGAFVIEPGEAFNFRVDMEKLSSMQNVLQLLELRIGLETDMAGLAAMRRTEESLAHIISCYEDINRLMREGSDSVEADFKFHLAIARATYNEYFIKFVRFLGTKTVPDRELVVGKESDADYVALINSEHLKIVTAIENKDVDAAREAARSHLTNSYMRHLSRANLQ